MVPVSLHKHRIWLTRFDVLCDKATCVEEHSLPMAAFPGVGRMIEGLITSTGLVLGTAELVSGVET